MQRVTVPYRREPGMLTPMPLLDVRLSHGEHSIQATVLFDSGAMISLLPFEYGQQLGLSQAEQRVEVQLGAFYKASRRVPLFCTRMFSPCHQ